MKKTLERRIWDNVTKVGECYIWNGSKNQKGRGQIRIGDSWPVVTRVVFEMVYGKFPDDLNVLHTCDNPSCINPDHLFLGTQDDNVKDMMNKGRWSANYGDTNGRTIIKDSDVVTIRARHKRGDPKHGTKALAIEFGVSLGTIQTIVNNHRR